MTTAHGIDRSGTGTGTAAPVPSAFIQTLLDDANAAEALATLHLDAQLENAEVTPFAVTLLDDTTAAAVLATLGALDTSIVDALGDKIVATAANTVQRAGFAMHDCNGALVATVAGNALTIALKGSDGNDPSSTNPVYVPFVRSGVTGVPSLLAVTAATSVVISSGSTLGTANGTPFRFWIVGFNDTGTFRLGVVNCRMTDGIFPLGVHQSLSSTAEGGAGAADSAGVVYTGTAVSSKTFAVLGYIEYAAGLATAGTYASAPGIALAISPGLPLPGDRVQVRRNQVSAASTTTTTIPLDNTIPQDTEGAEFMTQQHAPTSAANMLRISHVAMYGANADTELTTVALFKDNIADAVAAVFGGQAAAVNGVAGVITLEHWTLAGASANATWRIRAGPAGGNTVTFNGRASATVYGGVAVASLLVEEIMA